MLRRQVALAALVVGGLIPLGHMDTNFSVNLLVTTGVRGRYCSKACLGLGPEGYNKVERHKRMITTHLPASFPRTPQRVPCGQVRDAVQQEHAAVEPVLMLRRCGGGYYPSTTLVLP